MSLLYKVLVMLALTTLPAFAQQDNTADVIAKLRSRLDLQNEQITNITPIIEKYAGELQDLNKSIKDGTMNPSAIDSQRKGLEQEETQEISQYLKPYQVGQWQQLQAELDGKGGGDQNADEYSNLPQNARSQ